MTRTPLLITLAAAAALAGCNKENHTIVAGSPEDDTPTNIAANAHVQLPPTVVASKIYRCADNAVVYVDWLSDNKSANVRTKQSGLPTQVTTAEPGKPMIAPGGFEVSGSATASSAKIAIPGHPSQSCSA